MATTAAPAGAMVTSVSTPRSVAATPAAYRKLVTVARMVPVMAAPSEPIASSVAVVVMVANTTIQSRIRPTGYHSSGTGSAAGVGPAAAGRPSRARCPSHQAGSAIVTAKAMP